MTAQPARLLAAENELKQLMADVTRAMDKAQQAIARAAKPAAGDSEPSSSPR